MAAIAPARRASRLDVLRALAYDDPRAADIPSRVCRELVLEVMDLDAAEEFYADMLGVP